MTFRYSISQGNNVISYKTSQTGTTKQSAANQVFNYKYDTTVSPTSGANIDAARVNTFFLSNTIHDVRPFVSTEVRY